MSVIRNPRMSLKGLLVGGVLGALIGIGLEFVHYNRPKPVYSVSQVAAPAHSVSQVATPARPNDAREAWLKRRDLEFDRCATLHGTPTLGFGMRVVCLDSHAVKFLGEEHPTDE